jgi:hypothetical protein
MWADQNSVVVVEIILRYHEPIIHQAEVHLRIHLVTKEKHAKRDSLASLGSLVWLNIPYTGKVYF